MTKQSIGTIIVCLLTLYPAVSAQAFQGSTQGGGFGFTGPAGGGFTGPRGGGFTESLGNSSSAYNGSAKNRTSSFGMRRTVKPHLSANAFGNANRSSLVNNLNPAHAAGSVNYASTLNNANVNRTGVLWNNPYKGLHQGWVHGYWNGRYSGGLGWRPFGFGDPGLFGAASGGALGYGLAMGMGTMGGGLSSWIYGPTLYDFGYSSYSNPYYGRGNSGNTLVARQPAVYDYSRPINAQSTPPAAAVTAQAASNFAKARQSFTYGNDPRALELVDAALKLTPDDPALHEFRALTLFTLERYDEAASALYAVLSIAPGWDWTTLISLYGDPESYTQQLRALEACSTQNPRSAPAHFVLAYHYLTGEFADAAVRQLKLVTALEPGDTLSARLIEQIEHPQQSAAATSPAQPKGPTGPARTVQTVAATAPTGKQGKIEGTWTAHPSSDMNILVTFQEGGRFTWKVSRHGQDQQFQGKSRDENGILTLVQEQINNEIVGNLRWTDETHFVFKVRGAESGDPGLSFTKES